MDKPRKYKRLEIPLSLRMKLLGTAKNERGIKMKSRNVSLNGFLIETEIFFENDTLLLQRGEDPVHLDPFLVAGDNVLEFKITLPPDATIITAKGKIAWYQLSSRATSYYFKAGISLQKMIVEDGKRWIRFVRDLAQD